MFWESIRAPLVSQKLQQVTLYICYAYIYTYIYVYISIYIYIVIHIHMFGKVRATDFHILGVIFNSCQFILVQRSYMQEIGVNRVHGLEGAPHPIHFGGDT